MSTIPHKVMFIWPPVQRFLIWAGARLGVFGLVINIWHIVQFEFHWLLTTLQACCLPNGSLWRNNCEIHAVSWLCYMFTLWPTCPILWYLRLWGTLPGLLTLKRCLSGKQLQEALARTGVNRTLSHASRPQIWGKKLGVHDRISAPKVNLVKKTVDKTGRTRVVTRAFVWLGGTLGSRIGVWCAKHIKHMISMAWIQSYTEGFRIFGCMLYHCDIQNHWTNTQAHHCSSKAGNKKALSQSAVYPLQFGMTIASLVPTRGSRHVGPICLIGYSGEDELGSLDDLNLGRKRCWWRQLWVDKLGQVRKC